MAFYGSSFTSHDAQHSRVSRELHSSNGDEVPEILSCDLTLAQNLSLAHESIAELRVEVNELKCEIESLRNEISLIKGSGNADAPSASTVASSRSKLPNDLSSCVKQLHSTSEVQFNGSEMYASENNTKVKDVLFGHLQSKFGNQFSVKQLKGAIHRFYESRRRIFNDEQPQRIAIVEKNKINARKRQFRNKLYNDRKKVATTPSERERWASINYHFMTDESEHEDEDGSLVVFQHHIPWRSEKLDKLVKKLDSRIPPRKYPGPSKVVKEPSGLPIPNNAPDWTVNTQVTDSSLRIQ